MSKGTYQILADLMLVTHLGFVVFVVAGFLVIWAGYFLRWGFVRNVYFRALHLAAMGYVLLEALLGIACPLTVWEDRLRLLAGEEGPYQGSFIQHWVHRIMFFDVPEWMFTIVYAVFFALVILTFWLVPPRRTRGQRAAE